MGGHLSGCTEIKDFWAIIPESAGNWAEPQRGPTGAGNYRNWTFYYYGPEMAVRLRKPYTNDSLRVLEQLNISYIHK